jgi:hypothetical protein
MATARVDLPAFEGPKMAMRGPRDAGGVILAFLVELLARDQGEADAHRWPVSGRAFVKCPRAVPTR